MESEKKTTLVVENIINAPIDLVWTYWTTPEHITQWNNASSDWHTPRAENDLRVGGRFLSRMEARHGSIGFDFSGKYDSVVPDEYIEYTMDDGRKNRISFTAIGSTTRVVESFEAEEVNSLELQQGGWQAILDNFKKYVEGSE